MKKYFISLVRRITAFFYLQKIKNAKNIFKKLLNSEELNSFHEFNNNLQDLTKTSLQHGFELRFVELIELVNKYKIKSVSEIGTGRTTFLFNEILKTNTSSYEQDKNWMNTMINSYSWNPNIKLFSAEKYKNGGRLKNINNITTDLLYIDGPYIDYEYKLSFKGKPAYYDFEKINFDKPPKIILIDVRTDTVDEMLKSGLFKDYDFIGGYRFSWERLKLDVIKLKYHSIFIRK